MESTETALYAAIHAQPDEMRRLLAEGRDGAARAAALLRGRRVRLIGIGTSFHAACVGAWLLAEAGVDARAVHSFDAALYDRDLPPDAAYILISHRGTKTYSRQAGERIAALSAPCVAITAQGAPAPPATLHLETVPNERSSAHTVSYTGALTLLALIAAELGAEGVHAALPALPETVAAVLAREEAVRACAEAVAAARFVSLAGGGPNETTAAEGALKLRETAYLLAEGLGVEQLLHGPLVALGPEDALIAVRVPGPAAARLDAVCDVAQAIGVRVLIAGDDPGQGPLAVPGIASLPEVLTPLVVVVPLQLLACFAAAVRGTNPDSFRADDPRYRDAFARIAL